MATYSQLFGKNKGLLPNSVTTSNLASEVENGIIPVGTVFPIMENIAGATAIPGAGLVVKGLMYCNGDPIPAGQTLSGNVPDLTNSNFLMGTTSGGAGLTGGSNSSAHTHGYAHTHTNTHAHTITHSHSYAHTHTNTHTHEIPSNHGHSSGTYAAEVWISGGDNVYVQHKSTPTYSSSAEANGSALGAASGSVGADVAGDSGNTSSIAGKNERTTSASSNSTTNSQSTSTTSPASDTYSGGSSNSTTNSQNTDTTGGASITENRPVYLSTVYLIRVI